MKIFFMIIYSIILPLSSNSEIIPKLCINCKFYKKNFFTFSEFGKCQMFYMEDYNDNFLVNGEKNNNIEEQQFHYCSTARKFEQMCGKEGKFYEKK